MTTKGIGDGHNGQVGHLLCFTSPSSCLMIISVKMMIIMIIMIIMMIIMMKIKMIIMMITRPALFYASLKLLHPVNNAGSTRGHFRHATF